MVLKGHSLSMVLKGLACLKETCVGAEAACLRRWLLLSREGTEPMAVLFEQ